ncbi:MULTISPECIES: hypothetical protein [Comamonas]|jgi:hypothetical protein|uniref:hypothetical protein n=1 Tax=Comamonas TaxID=283 RepID=UPI0003645708|nr:MULTISPECIES: hypothetical protein [Comamonas]
MWIAGAHLGIQRAVAIFKFLAFSSIGQVCKPRMLRKPLAHIDAVAGLANRRELLHIRKVVGLQAPFIQKVRYLTHGSCCTHLLHHMLAEHTACLYLAAVKDGAHQGRLEHQAGFFHSLAPKAKPRSDGGVLVT